MSGGFSIEADHYRLAREALRKDPIVQAMAAEVFAVEPLVRDLMMVQHSFMVRALDEYHGRGGVVPTHIGGPAEAIRELVRQLDEEASRG